MTEAIEMKIEKKLKRKQVIFSFIDNWTRVIHHVERWLDVGLVVEPQRIRLRALEDDALNVFDEIISDEHVIKKLKLQPYREIFDGPDPFTTEDVDCSFLSVYAAHDGRVKIVSLVPGAGGENV